MKTKRLRIGSLVVLLSLIAAIPASTQVQLGSSDGNTEGGNLPLLVLVNRMELSPEQMEGIHGLLVGLLEERDAIDRRRAELEEEMIAFTGTAEELDEILEAFRVEMRARIEAAREQAEDAIDRIKEILTLKQGEILEELFPWLLADRTAPAQRIGSGRMLGQRGTRIGEFRLPFGQRNEDIGSGLRGQILGHLEGRLADLPEILEQLRQRLGETRREGGRMAVMNQQLGCQAQIGMGFRQRGDGSEWRAAGHLGAMRHRGLDVVERLVEVLKLKLEAIG